MILFICNTRHSMLFMFTLQSETCTYRAVYVGVCIGARVARVGKLTAGVEIAKERLSGL